MSWSLCKRWSLFSMRYGMELCLLWRLDWILFEIQTGFLFVICIVPCSVWGVNWILFLIYIRLRFICGTKWIVIYFLDYTVLSVRNELNLLVTPMTDDEYWKVYCYKNRSKSSIQWSGSFSLNRDFQGKHLYAGENVCVVSVFHEGSWLALDAMKQVVLHNTVLWLVSDTALG
jgi:hypothetical protein